MLTRTTPQLRKTSPTPLLKKLAILNFEDESDAQLLKTAKQLIRVDYGGKNPVALLKKKLSERFNIDAAPRVLEAIVTLSSEQVDGCRKRIFPRIDEAIRRATERERGKRRIVAN